jgi:hypothetical protein
MITQKCVSLANFFLDQFIGRPLIVFPIFQPVFLFISHIHFISCFWILNRIFCSPLEAKLFGEKIITVDETFPLILFPNEGNIHTFRALEESAFFDILIPPYSSERQITYFREISSTSQPSQFCSLVPFVPFDFVCEEERYTGPPVTIQFPTSPPLKQRDDNLH